MYHGNHVGLNCSSNVMLCSFTLETHQMSLGRIHNEHRCSVACGFGSKIVPLAED